MQLLIVGAVALLAQVTLLRELSVAFYGSELIVVLALGVWLLGSGTGAVLPAGTAERSRQRLFRCFLAAAVVLPLSLAAARGLHHLFGGVPGAYLQLPRQLVGLLLVLVPVALIAGRLFRLAAVAHIHGGGTAARAYAWESMGSLAGGVAATLLIFLGRSNLFALLLTALLAALAALGQALPSREGTSTPAASHRGGPGNSRLFSSFARLRLPVLISSVVAMALVVGMGRAPRLDRALTRWNHPFLAATRDTPYGRLTLDRRAGQLAVFVNNALSYESQGTAAEEFAQLAALQVEDLRKVLVLGGGAEGLVDELVKFHPRRIDLVELDAAGFALRLALLGGDTGWSDAADSPVTVVFGDPRRRLRRLGEYDLVLLGMPQPESGQANRFYTEEFYRECRRHLGAEGVLALRLRSAENLWTPLLTWRNASVVKALKEVFGEVIVLPGTVSVVVAGDELPPADEVARRFEQRRPPARLMSAAYIHYLYGNDRRQQIVRLIEESPAPVNTDRRPVGYVSSLLLWLSRFDPSLALRKVIGVRMQGTIAVAVFVVLALPLLLLGRSGNRIFPRIALAATAGLSAMVLEGVLVLAYQTARGVLYQDLGLLLSLFMVGLAMGASIADRRAEGEEDAGGDVSSPTIPRRFRWNAFSMSVSSVLLAGTSILSLAVAGLLWLDWTGSLMVSALLLMVTGSLTGALFAVASRGRSSQMRRNIGRLYGADLVGGCVGAVLTSLVLAPVLGLAFTVLLLAALNLVLAGSLRA